MVLSEVAKIPKDKHGENNPLLDFVGRGNTNTFFYG